MKKIKNKKGETLVETLVTTLIIASCFAMLCGAIVSAAKVNSGATKLNKDFTETSLGVSTVYIGHNKEGSEILTDESVSLYSVNGKYYYVKK